MPHLACRRLRVLRGGLFVSGGIFPIKGFPRRNKGGLRKGPVGFYFLANRLYGTLICPPQSQRILLHVQRLNPLPKLRRQLLHDLLRFSGYIHTVEVDIILRALLQQMSYRDGLNFVRDF